MKATWEDLIEEQAEAEANLPWCLCCKGKILPVERFRPDADESENFWSIFGFSLSELVFCTDCYYHEDFEWDINGGNGNPCNARISDWPKPTPKEQMRFAFDG